MKVVFTACDKLSSGTFSESVDVTSEESLQTEWDHFKARVPFNKWFPSNSSDVSATIEEDAQIEEWLDNLS